MDITPRHRWNRAVTVGGQVAAADTLPGHPAAAGPAGPGGAALLDDAPRRRQKLYGRLAAVFFTGSGALGLVTLPLPAPGSDTAAMAVLFTLALIVGVAIWLAPWERWPRWVSLCIVPPAFALIALGNTFGGLDQHTYSLFFVVAFVWIGLAHPSRTSLAMAPLAAAAYILPMFTMPGDLEVAVSSAAGPPAHGDHPPSPAISFPGTGRPCRRRLPACLVDPLPRGDGPRSPQRPRRGRDRHREDDVRENPLPPHPTG